MTSKLPLSSSSAAKRQLVLQSSATDVAMTMVSRSSVNPSAEETALKHLTAKDLLHRLQFTSDCNQVLQATKCSSSRILRRPKATPGSLVVNKQATIGISEGDLIGTEFLHSLQRKAANVSESSLPDILRRQRHHEQAIDLPQPRDVIGGNLVRETVSPIQEAGCVSLDGDIRDGDKASSRRSFSAVSHHRVKSSKAGSVSSLKDTSMSLEKSNQDVRDSAPWNSHRPDPKLVLVYLQKNVFDNTVPQNDQFLSVLLEKRARRGFTNDLPEHKTGFRSRLSQLFDEIDPNPEKQMAKGLDADNDDGDFVYALHRNRRSPRTAHDPYDLQVVSAEEARTAPVYYCATAVGVTRIELREGGLPPIVDRTRSLEWMWERKLFYMINDKRIFVQFRMWKAFRVWLENVRAEKTSFNRLKLMKSLFTTNEVLLGCLLHIRGLCESATPGTRRSGISLIAVDRTMTVTLAQFEENQRKQRQLAESQLKALSEKIICLMCESCSVVAETEGVSRAVTSSGLKSTTAEEATKAALNAVESSRITYAQVVQWRHILKRLSSFLRLVDSLILSLLHHLGRTALDNLHQFVLDSYEASSEHSLSQRRDSKAGSQSRAIITVQLVLNSSADSSGPTRAQPVDDCDEHSDQASVADSESESDNSSRCRLLLSMSPTTDELIAGFRQTEAGFQETILTVKSLYTEPRLSVFYIPLKCRANNRIVNGQESTDEDNSDEDSRSARDEWTRNKARTWPDVNVLFEQDTTYCQSRSHMFQCLNNNCLALANYANEFNKYAVMVEQAVKLDTEMSLKKQPWMPDVFHRQLSLHTENVSQLSQMLTSRQVGIVRVLSDGFQRSCLPLPRSVVRTISIQLPIIAGQRNKQLSCSIKEASLKLEQQPSSVEEFVQHLIFLGKLSSDLPVMETEYSIITKFYNVAKDFDVFVPPEDLALYQVLPPSFQHLKTAILHADVRKEGNARRFIKDLNTSLDDIKRKLFEIKNDVADASFVSANSQPEVVLQRISWLTDNVAKLLHRSNKFTSYQERLIATVASAKKRGQADEFTSRNKGEATRSREINAELTELETNLTLRRMLWESVVEWERISYAWLQTSFESLNVDDIQATVQKFVQTIYVLEKGLSHNSVIVGLKQRVQDFQNVLPIVISLRNPALRDRHWRKIENVIDKSIVTDSAMKLGDLLDARITRHRDTIHEISATASNEATLDRMLQKISDIWTTTDFRLVPHTSGTVVIIAGADEMQSLLEESQVTLGMIRGSRYAGPFKVVADDWDHKLVLFAKTLDTWIICQRNWIYLEQIFNTPDIQRQLPAEHKLFQQVDASWRDVMRRTAERPNALKASTAPGILDALSIASQNLDKVQKSLEDYLETKRLVFPRFYFLSNDELLDILAQSKDYTIIQSHLIKCFSNIKRLDIHIPPRQPPTVKAMISLENEVVLLPKNIRARGPVEQWLDAVETGMFDTVKRHVKTGLHSWSDDKFDEWILDNPGQVVLTVAQIMFSKDVEGCLCSNNIDPSINRQSTVSGDTVQANQANHTSPCTLDQLSKRMLSSLQVVVNLSSLTLKHHQMLSVNALLTIYVHCRDIVDMLVVARVTSISDFQWSRQLKYNWDLQSNLCSVSQCTAQFVYGYEYLGCCPRLVVTPLTDRCYLTLTTAHRLNLGGSPIGPAGTGKTETVKDLARAMGKHCIIFNCSESLNIKMLGCFFSGLAQSGSWACFDEFNRIDVEVLSVVAQQMQTIKLAKGHQASRFIFEGCDIKLNLSCGIFITMNPNYAGRVELPDNLKSLFRPVAMVVPDYALIAEIILFSEGFAVAKMLSTKIVNVYMLASRQLSQQCHYDFGLRAIKSAVVMAGQKKHVLQASDNKKLLSSEEEILIVFHALHDANVPKLLAQDVILFLGILNDLFPGIGRMEPQIAVLHKAVEMSCDDLGLQRCKKQFDKICQLYGQMLVRHGVMLIGPTSGGKTAVRNILQRALTLLPCIDSENILPSENSAPISSVMNRHRKGAVETFVINPKSFSLGNLYGEVASSTFQWTDGLVARAFRNFAKKQPSANRETSDTKDGSVADILDETVSVEGAAEDVVTNVVDINTIDWQWIVLDGPVDPHWIENLNTVLDDSKVLCLSNGERIGMSPSMRLMFEVDDLSYASPATISRCAMVYMDPADLDWHLYVHSWFDRLPARLPTAGRRYLLSLIDKTVDKGLAFLRSHATNVTLRLSEHNVILCLCSLLAAYLDFMSTHGGFGTSDENDEASLSDNLSKSQLLEKSSSVGPRTISFSNVLPPGVTDKSTHVEEQKLYFMQKNPSLLTSLLGKLYVFAFIWSFGGNLKRQDEYNEDFTNRVYQDNTDFDVSAEFDGFIRSLFDMSPPLGVRLPLSMRSVFSHFVDLETGTFISWESLVPSTESLITQDPNMYLSDSLSMTATSNGKMAPKDTGIVMTTDTVRYSFLTSLLLLNRRPVLLVGESGVGKTALIKNILRRLELPGGTSMTDSGAVVGCVMNYTDKNQVLLQSIASISGNGHLTEDVVNLLDDGIGDVSGRRTTDLLVSKMQFGVQTSISRTQQTLTGRLVKRGRDHLSPPKGKQLVAFIDDLNLPTPEAYGAQPPLEFLRQFLDLGGFYDVKKLAWIEVTDVTLLSACGVLEGGRNPISQRLLKHFCLLSLPQPSTQSLQHIFKTQLGRFFNSREFSAEVRDCCSLLVTTAIAVYRQVAATLRPTPFKIHYTFNVRDLSQVITGLMQANETVIISRDSVIQLLAHETTRVFHDRLTDQTDSATFFNLFSGVLYNNFKIRWGAEQLKSDMLRFADFVEDVDVSPLGMRLYKPVLNFSKLQRILEDLHGAQNVANTKAIRMVFFPEMIDHIIRAARVLRQPAGHILLVGVDGTGKRAALELAACVSQCQIYRLAITNSYTLLDLRADLKRVCLMAGVKGIKTVLFLSDKSALKDSFLEDISSILNTGEIPDLFDSDEFENITMELKSALAEAQIPETFLAVHQFFFQRVRMNLHVALSMSPAGGLFRQRCRTNPSLVSCCTIDWYHDWDSEAMLSVAKVYFNSVEFSADGSSDQMIRGPIANICVRMHESVVAASTLFWEELRRHNYVTPSSYMELIYSCTRLLASNRAQILANKDRLTCGLSRLTETNELVGVMQSDLILLGPQIENKAKDTEKLLSQLEKDQEAVEQVRKIIQEEEITMKEEAEVVEEYAKECQRDLESVMPILEAAIESLDALDKSDVAEIRVYTHPPETVKMVISAVCLLLGEDASSWTVARQSVADPQFLKRLIEINKDAIPEKVFTKLRKYTSHAEFTPAKMGEVSKACQSLCMWVLAVEHYHNIYKMAKPKHKRLEDATAALQLAQKNLAHKQASLHKIELHLVMLQEHYRESVEQREALKLRKDLTTVRLHRAAIMIAALSDEKERWAQSVSELDFKLRTLPGDMLLSAGIVAYCGIFPSRYRRNLLSLWINMCEDNQLTISSNFNMVTTLVPNNQVLHWHNDGLPQDQQSIENAVIVQCSRKWPLFIDPQGQASQWIKQREGNRLKQVQSSDTNCLRVIERAIRFGEPVLLQIAGESLDLTLRPVLMQETLDKSGHQFIVLNDTEIAFNSNFSLYLATSMSNPHFLPAVCNLVTVINFMVTFDGLREQLLSTVVRQEQPMLESNKIQLLSGLASDLQLLRDLEDMTLGLLQKSEGHILDRQDLIDSLHKSQGMSGEIEKRVKQSEEAELQLNQARNKYLPVATRGTAVYFVLDNLAQLNSTYQFSLSWFQSAFSLAIKITETTQHHAKSRVHDSDSVTNTENGLPQSPEPEEKAKLDYRMQRMIDRVTAAVYRVARIGLFAKHRRMFSFILCINIIRCEDEHRRLSGLSRISESEWLTFLRGGSMTSRSTDASSGDRPPWIGEAVWIQCCHLANQFDCFRQLTKSLVKYEKQWSVLMSADQPYSFMDNEYTACGGLEGRTDDSDDSLSFKWTSLSPFQRLMLVKVLLPSKLGPSVDRFVEQQFGTEFVYTDDVTDGLRLVFQESSAKTPIIFVLSPGTNPTTSMLQLAKELRGNTIHVDIVSLGRSQGVKAEELIAKAQLLKGRWVCLQNCHLAASWMPRLQSIIDNFSKPGTEMDPNFRLWLSSKPDPCFPTSVLQSGFKVAVEAPSGIKVNLLRSFGSNGVVSALFDEDSRQDRGRHVWKSLLFGLCIFNAVVHERRKYEKLGWNVSYEFIDADLEVSLLQLKMLITSQISLDWSAVSYLIGDVIYGGRVSDEWDLRCLHSLLHKFLYPQTVQPDFNIFEKFGSLTLGGQSSSDVRSFVEQLPNNDLMDLFSMGTNAELALVDSQSRQLIKDLQTGQPRLTMSISNATKSSDVVVLEMAADMQKALPEKVDNSSEEKKGSVAQLAAQLSISDIVRITNGDIIELLEKLDASESLKKQGLNVEKAVNEVVAMRRFALTTVLLHEVDCYDRLLLTVHQTLSSLSMAVRGEVVMSDSLEDTYDKLLKNIVPTNWMSVSYASCKTLGAWVKDLLARIDFIRRWSERFIIVAQHILQPYVRAAVSLMQSASKNVNAGTTPIRVADLHADSYWLPGFFFPQGFLTAVLQQYARSTGVSIDSLRFDFRLPADDGENSLGSVNKLRGVNMTQATENAQDISDADCVLVHGLHIDGAQWDSRLRCLVDSTPGQRFASLPPIYFIPSSVDGKTFYSFGDTSLQSKTIERQSMVVSRDDQEHSNQFECPVYQTSLRSTAQQSTMRNSGYVTSVMLDSGSEAPHFWVMRGVALLCQIDD